VGPNLGVRNRGKVIGTTGVPALEILLKAYGRRHLDIAVRFSPPTRDLRQFIGARASTPP